MEKLIQKFVGNTCANVSGKGIYYFRFIVDFSIFVAITYIFGMDLKDR